MDKMRTEFEKWVKTQPYLSIYPLNKDEEGDYLMPLNGEYCAFEAGYQAATKEAEKYREALEKIASAQTIPEELEASEIAKQALKK